MKTSTKILAILAATAVLIPSSFASTNTKTANTTTPVSVQQLDIKRYAGHWYEIARLPLYFQRKCASDVTATYRIQSNGKIEVDNQCKTAEGKGMQSIGQATPTDRAGQLKVTFLPKGLRWLPFGQADYWVLAVDDNYQYALVGTPNQKNLWVLSRTPTMPDATYQALINQAAAYGYPVSQVTRTAQSR